MYIPLPCTPVLLGEFYGRTEHLEAARARWKTVLGKRNMTDVFNFAFPNPAEYEG